MHPIGEQGQSFEMAFCAEVCGISWIRRAIKQHILQSKEVKCSISGQHELASMAKFLWCICWKTVLEGNELYHFCLGTELSPPLWMLPSVYLKAVPNKLRYPHMAVNESNVFSLILAILDPSDPLTVKQTSIPPNLKVTRASHIWNSDSTISHLFQKCLHCLLVIQHL